MKTEIDKDGFWIIYAGERKLLNPTEIQEYQRLCRLEDFKQKEYDKAYADRMNWVRKKMNQKGDRKQNGSL